MTKVPVTVKRQAAVTIGGLCVSGGLTSEEYTELLTMLGIIGDAEETNYEEQEPHDYQSKYRHYRSIGVA